MQLPVKLSEALLGGRREIHTLNGEITITVPAGVAFAEVFRVRGKGVPFGDSCGDLLVKISVEMPKKLSKKARELVEALKDEGM